MTINNDLLIKLQQTELDILKVFTDYLDGNSINYSLAYGTALGAVRHQDFIPWDDDIDIFIPYAEFNRLKRLWGNKNIPGYYFQDIGEQGLNHCKIRKDGTVFLEKEEESNNDSHHGIWLDIFPLYKVKKRKRSLIYIRFWNLLRLITTRISIPKQSSLIYKIIYRSIDILPGKFKVNLHKKANKNIVRYETLKDNYYWIDLCNINDMRKIYPKDCFESFTNIRFGAYKFKISKLYDKMLKIEYGNYMQLPPKSEQLCTHSPIEIKL